MGNTTKRLETVMLWLSLPSFGAGFALTAAAAYYGSIFTALAAIFSSSLGVILYFAYRVPTMFEDMDSPDERRKREARREFSFLFMLLFIAWFSYLIPANLFYNTFSNMEEIMVVALPSSLGLVGLAVLLLEFLKRPPESLLQPEKDRNLTS